MESLQDIKRVIAKGKSEEIIKTFIKEYLISEKDIEDKKEYENLKAEFEEKEATEQDFPCFDEWLESKYSDDAENTEPTPEEIEKVYAELWEERRIAAYGGLDTQLEEIYDNGLAAWKARIMQVKKDIPKNKS